MRCNPAIEFALLVSLAAEWVYFHPQIQIRLDSYGEIMKDQYVMDLLVVYGDLAEAMTSMMS